MAFGSRHNGADGGGQDAGSVVTGLQLQRGAGGAAAWAAMGSFWPATRSPGSAPASIARWSAHRSGLGVTAPFIVSGLLTALPRRQCRWCRIRRRSVGRSAWLVPEASDQVLWCLPIPGRGRGADPGRAVHRRVESRGGGAAGQRRRDGSDAGARSRRSGGAWPGRILPCLTAIAIGVVLLPPGRRAWVLAVVGSVLTVVVDRASRRSR